MKIQQTPARPAAPTPPRQPGPPAPDRFQPDPLPGKEILKTLAIGATAFAGLAAGAWAGEAGGTALMQAYPATPALAVGLATSYVGAHLGIGPAVIGGVTGLALTALVTNLAPDCVAKAMAIAGACAGAGLAASAAAFLLKPEDSPQPKPASSPIPFPASLLILPGRADGLVPLSAAAYRPVLSEHLGLGTDAAIAGSGLCSNAFALFREASNGRHDVMAAAAGTGAAVALGASLASLANPAWQPLAQRCMTLYCGAQIVKSSSSALRALTNRPA